MMKKVLHAGLAAVLLTCALPAAASANETAPTPAPASPSATSSAPTVRVVVLLKGQPGTPDAGTEKARLATQKSLVERWSATHGLKVNRQFGYLVNGFSAELPADQLQSLAFEPEVLSVRKERVYQPVEHNGRDLEGVPAAFAQHGVDGTGMVVSIIDSGIDATHQDMRLDNCAAAKITTVNPHAEGNFSCKVPDGYNYADENYVVKDLTSSQHGMHVSGIVAANGSVGSTPDFPTSGRIDGVAPNAQLLAMKVFSNNGGGAHDADIIAAIEDSVKLGADVINMSLGSPNSVKDTSDGAARAIELARQSGVLTVVAAGNDGLNFSKQGDTTDVMGLFDDGTAGSPAVQGSGLTVASIDNKIVTQLKAVWTSGGASHAMPFELQVGNPDGADHVVVDAGFGRPGDFPADVAGKYVLIERGGDVTFATKFQNAVDKHAAGVIIFNSVAGGEDFLSMGGIEKMPVFGVSLRHSDGAAMKAAITAGATTVRFTRDTIQAAVPTASQPSYFTSWGSTTTLDFEPEIAGIGGSVYSTLNANTYGTKSGTSMAAPNVAGMSALLLQQLHKQYPNTSRTELTNQAQIALMNTALTPKTANGVEAAPRQIGAGLAQIDKALNTAVLATVEGQASVALREVNAPRTFTVTLTNRGEQPVSYAVPAQSVLTESNAAGQPTTMAVGGGTLAAGASAVTVPGKGTATVSFTLTPDTSSSHFVEGWARLTSTTPDQPDLAVPYLGFVGDWNKEAIVAPVDQDVITGVASRTTLATSWQGMTIPLAGDMGTFWQSPNGDGDVDIVAPLLALRRNAEEIHYSVLRADGTLVKDLGADVDQRREIMSAWLAEKEPSKLMVTGRTFDGTTWDPAKGDFVAVPDGAYIYRVQARLGKDTPYQVLDMPFKLDNTAPVLTFGELTGTTVTLTVTETGSGIMADPEVTATDGKSLPVTKVADNQYTIQIADPAQIPFVTASVLDHGFNLGTATKVFAKTSLVVADAASLNDPAQPIGPNSPVVSKNSLRVNGYVSSDIAKVRIGSQVVDAPNGRYAIPTPLVEGKNTIVVEGLDAAGKVVATVTVTPIYDTIAPKLTLTGVLDAQGHLAVAADGSVTVKGSISDERAGAKLSVNVDGKSTPVGADGTFSVTFTPKPEQTSVVVKGSDVPNSTTSALLIAGRQAAGPWQPPSYTNVQCVPKGTACFVPATTKDASADKKFFTLKGTITSPTKSISFAPAPGVAGTVIGNQTPIEATINPDGTFSVVLPIVTGINHFRQVVVDGDGKTQVDMGTSLYVDIVAPSVHFDQPNLFGGVLYTNQDQQTFAGTASDDGWGYTLSLNDSKVVDVMYQTGFGPESNQRSFSTKVAVKNGDQLLMVFNDSNGNALTGVVPIVVDRTAPQVTLPVTEGTLITDGRTLTTTASDATLATLKVTLNGKVVADLATPKAGQKAALETALVSAQTSTTPAEASTAGSTAVGSTAATSSADVPAAAPAAAPAAGVVPAADSAPATLSYPLATSELAPGAYSMTVESRDLAGNVTLSAVSFTVNLAPVVTGPDTATITVGRELLGDQAELARRALAAYAVTDDATPAPALALAPGTVLVEGNNPVTLVVNDGVTTTQRAVTITVALQQVTISNNGASATSTFRTDDSLTARSATNPDGSVAWTLSNDPRFAAQQASISLPGAEGQTVVQVLADGREVPVPASFAQGLLTFTGSSKAVYKVLPKPASSSTDPGHSTIDGDTTPSASANLSATGLSGSAMALGLAGLALLTMGGVLVRRRG